ncbi:MAG: DUF2194 domain-containing protein [Treponema sp.]|nr:DUF2194 domain-containing protein [Treponema sp.]
MANTEKKIIKKKKYANALWIILLPLAVFILLGAFVAIERAGIPLDPNTDPVALPYLPADLIIPRSEQVKDLRCLFVYNSDDPESEGTIPNITFILNQMSVGYDIVDMAKTDIPDLTPYKTMVIGASETEPMFLALDSVINWVFGGGGLLFAITPDDETLTTIFNRLLGVERGTYDYIPQVTAKLETDFLTGGKGVQLVWSEENKPDDYRYGLNFKLTSDCTLHMSSTGPEGPTPMLWEHKFGNGRVVVNNNDAIYEKWSRGFFAASYSMTEPAVAYPVINASVIFIDDFPSPVPEGYNPYIRRDYGMQTENFFVHIWFPDMLAFSDKYGFKYTGLFVETYDDNVNSDFVPEPQYVSERMKYFGTLFLNHGNEIGMHGYNHQSLVLPNFDYGDELDYNKWPSLANMKTSLDELVRYDEEMFPGTKMRIYVPPSNVLSHEGRTVIRDDFKDIRVISGLLVDDLYNLEDEFGLGEDGLINFPRITSGYFPFDDPDDITALWSMLCEINLHFVNSHFIHPDDTMDDERGAARGWRSLSKSFDEYLAWLGQFPLRHLTGHQAGPATERWDNLSVKTTLSSDQIALELTGFYDEAWLLVRINEGTPLATDGGSLTKMSDTLYLLKATMPEVTITLEPAEQ